MISADASENAHVVSQCIVGADGCFLEVDDGYAALLGVAPAELTGRHLLDVTHPDDRCGNARQLGRLITFGEAFEITKRYCRPDGTVIWVRNHVSAFRDGLGKHHMMATCRLLGVEGDLDPRAAWHMASRASHMFRVGRRIFGDGMAGSVAPELLLLLYTIEAEGRGASIRILAADLGYPLSLVTRWIRALIDLDAVGLEGGTLDDADAPVLLSRSGFARIEALLTESLLTG